jgi:hypothetical protein
MQIFNYLRFRIGIDCDDEISKSAIGGDGLGVYLVFALIMLDRESARPQRLSSKTRKAQGVGAGCEKSTPGTNQADPEHLVAVLLQPLSFNAFSLTAC